MIVQPQGTRLLSAALAAALAVALAGCGTKQTVEGGNDTFSATTLTVYSDLPLLGPDGAQMTDIVNGEALALYDAGGHVGRLHVSLESLNDDADPLIDTGLPTDTLQTAQSAHTASSDLSTAAYIGDFDSAATAISLPLNSENDVLQISPASSYVGLTDSNPVDVTGDPAVFYPDGSRTFARLVPSDVVEAAATVTYMRSLGVKRLCVLRDTSNPPYDSVIAQLVAGDAAARGISVVCRALERSGIDTQTAAEPSAYAKVAAAVAAAAPGAVLFGGEPDAGAQSLWRALHERLAQLKLFAPSTLATPAFLAGLRQAAGETYVTSPILEPGQYPAKAQSVFAQYRRRFALAPTPYVLYGYEAMSDVLAAIRRAGREAAKRSALVHAFFHLGEIRGVLGDYSFNADGDTSLAAFDGYRVSAAGALVLVRRIG